MKKIIISGLLILIIISFSCKKKSQSGAEPEFDFNAPLTENEKATGILTPEILWKFGRVSDHQLSPDNKTVIFGVTRYNVTANKGITDIFSVPSSGGDAVRLTDSRFSYSNARFIPGTANIAFLSSEGGPSQVWIMNADGSGKKMISEIPGDVNGFEFSPDGKKLYYLQDVKIDMSPQDIHPDLPMSDVLIAEDLMYRHWNTWTDYKYSHIFITGYDTERITAGIDIMDGEPCDAPLSPYFDQAEISWSPDSRYLAYTSKKMKGRDYAVSTNSDIFLYSIADSTTENLSRGMPGYDKYPEFSPDGTMLAWQSMETPGYESDKSRLFLVDLGTGRKSYLTENLNQSISDQRWADNNTIFFISGTKATFQVYKIDVKTKEITQLTKGKHDYTSISLGNDFITGEKMTLSMASEIFRISLITGEETQLSFINKDIYESIKMGDVEERWITTTDRKQMLTWVIYPPGFDSAKQYPAILYCQGGPQSVVSQFFSFRWNLQLMAANGYIVVAPNRRGLPTFGEEWNRQISGDYGGQNIKDYLSAIDDLSKESYVDRKRLGAVGASYGGYSVYYLAGHHEGRFRALISHAGIFNLISMYGATEEMFFVNFDLGGPYWQKPVPKSYQQFSPHLYVDKWDTPIMIIAGGNDMRVPYTQSLEAFNAAQLQGIPSKLLHFPDETHFIARPQNAILWQREFFSWLDKWLKNGQ